MKQHSLGKVNVAVFFQWEEDKCYVKNFVFDMILSTTNQQCDRCWFRAKRLHCPNIPCGKYARPDGQAIYFKMIKEK